MPSELTDAAPLLMAVSLRARLAAKIAARNNSDNIVPAGAVFVRLLIGARDLPQDLRLAQRHRLQPAAYAE